MDTNGAQTTFDDDSPQHDMQMRGLTTEDSPSDSHFGKIIHESVSHEFTQIQTIASRVHSIYTIHKAQRHGKWFMLKSLTPEYATVTAMHELLHKEFAIGFNLEHPNVMRTYGIETVPSIGECIVCEWIDGVTLTDLVTSQGIKLEQALDICRAIAEAVEYLHSKQVLHLDLKLSNIMVTRIGTQPKIIDFGMSDVSDYAVFKAIGGTKGYMAPEAMTGNAEVDARTDIYALGVIIDKINASLPSPNRRLKRISAKCMRINPADRYGSIAEIKWAHPSVPLYVLALIAVAMFGCALATPYLWPRVMPNHDYKVDTIVQYVEVHDTVLTLPPVDTVRQAFLSSLEKRISGIVSEEWEREFELLINPRTHSTEEISANYRKFYDGYASKATSRVRAIVDEHITKDDPDYFKIMSGAVAICQQAVADRNASQSHNQRVMDAMLGE